ncbi:hypothetical protein DENSPDRAFT_215888 [Dentipellis sp. KUC8613]|nr:hypothetical protein DENSPDRAFT_215888 [Dentipellis sp. KUC8613]
MEGTIYSEDSAERGCWPRHRRPSPQAKKGNAIVGLPFNWYNPAWLAKQSQAAIKELSIKPPVDITLSESVRREAARYLHINGDNHVPDDPGNVDLSELDSWIETGILSSRA